MVNRPRDGVDVSGRGAGHWSDVSGRGAGHWSDCLK